ncbi:MAG: DUF5058 family protein [Lachnospiraceae bacterium]|nr:DUF5058 family protein [Lachnospiraceae bacterium]
MSFISRLNQPVFYLICGGIVLAVALICVLFAVRAYRAGKAIGMDPAKMKRVIVASATFAILPSVGILLGVIALSGSLGTPWPWLRLSVIGALHYETQVAEAAAAAVGGSGLSASSMTAESFATIALLMSVCIMWGMVFATISCKAYSRKLMNPAPRKAKKKTGGANLRAFGDPAMTALFIGLVSTYIGSYIGGFVSGGPGGRFSFSGSLLPLAVALVGALSMAAFTWLKEKKKAEWIDSFSVAGSMLIAMASAVFLGKIL